MYPFDLPGLRYEFEMAARNVQRNEATKIGIPKNGAKVPYFGGWLRIWPAVQSKKIEINKVFFLNPDLTSLA